MPSVCAVVPVYEHEHAIAGTVAGLRAHGLTVILVDDGSGASCAAELHRLAAADAEVRLVRLPVNQGKGGAVMAGLVAAADAGFSHALQIDADGQHDASDVFWDTLSAGFSTVAGLSSADLVRARAIAKRWRDQELSFVDCTSFAFIERLGLERALAFDLHFRLFRFGPNNRRRLELV